MIKKIINNIKDNNFKINYVNNSLNIVNYDNLLEVQSEVISLKTNNRVIYIKGQDLRLTKLLEQEILITGMINKIEL